VGAKGNNPSTVTEVAHNRGAKAVYKGLALAQASDGKPYLTATNFHSGRIEVYSGAFKRSTCLVGYLLIRSVRSAMGRSVSPRSTASCMSRLPSRTPCGTTMSPGGATDSWMCISNDGAFVRRLVTRGALSSPWGLALAPSGFGQFSGDLLVGNLGNGHINVYSPATGTHLGQLRRANGRPIVIDGLWGLRFGGPPVHARLMADDGSSERRCWTCWPLPG